MNKSSEQRRILAARHSTLKGISINPASLLRALFEMKPIDHSWFDDSLLHKVSFVTITEIVRRYIDEFGGIQAVNRTEAGYTIDLARGILWASVTVSPTGKIIGLWFDRAEPVPDRNASRSIRFSKDEPAQPHDITQHLVEFATDNLVAPGVLTLPKQNAENPPIAVLVAGSGIQDRDATIGHNRLFQQFAWGLGTRGIASLRFDRRPRFAPASFASDPDLDHEIVIDAASALAFCSNLPDVNQNQIYLLGHSLGAVLAPDIAFMRLKQQSNSVHGLVLISGAARPIDVVMLDQISTFGEEAGMSKTDIKNYQEEWVRLFSTIRDVDTSESELLGTSDNKVPVRYWRDWLNRDPVQRLSEISIPSLVLRGADDRKSTSEDFRLLTNASSRVSSSANCEFEGLDHECMGIDVVTNCPSNVQTIPAVVFSTITDWIHRQVKHDDLY